SATGSMSAARQQCPAVLLPNGKVLVIGGFSNNVILSSNELYDPATGTFSATGSMGAARWRHTAALLPNGKVLVAGGANPGGTLSSVELYDPAAGTFSATGSMGVLRQIFTATILPNGKVLVAAGADGSTNIWSAVELYDPAAGTFTAAGSMSVGRGSHAATLLPDGKVLVTGGHNGTAAVSSADLYDTYLGDFITPLDPALSSVHSSSLTYSWTSIAGANYIAVLASDSGYGSIVSSSAVGTNSKVFTDLSPATNYYFEVKLSTETDAAFALNRRSTATLADSTPPTAAILQPIDGSYLYALSLVSGTASDDEAVSSVTVSVLGDGLYWDGSDWGAGRTWLDGTGFASSWTYSGMPLWVDGTTYTINARARDSSGNWTANYSTSTFHFESELPAGCAQGFNVKQDGSRDFTAIQAAVDALPRVISGDACVIVRDTQTYAEQVTVQGMENNGYRLKILADPAFVSSSPAVSPPAASNAAFRVLNASVTISGFRIVPSTAVPYGIRVSSEAAALLNVDVQDAGGNISVAGIALSTACSVSGSTAAVAGAYGIYLNGSGNTLSNTLSRSNSGLYAAVHLAGASSNIFQVVTASNPAGHGLSLAGGSDYNTVTQSVITGGGAGAGLRLLQSSGNNVNNSFVYNPSGYGAQLGSGSNNNSVTLSTITANSTYMAFNIDNSVSNTVSRCHISNPAGYGVFIGYGADRNNISSGTINSGAAAYFAVKLVSVASNTVSHNMISNPAGVALTSVFGGWNLVSYSTITSAAWAYNAVFIDASDYNTVQNSYVHGANGLFIRDSTGTTVSYNIIAATNTAGTGLRLDTSRDISVEGNEVSAPATGIFLNTGNTGTITLASNTVSGAFYGLSIDAQAAGAVLAVSGINFNSLPPNTTAINFLGGAFVSTFTGIGFNDADIGVNVDGSLLGSGSRITMRDAFGLKYGSIYERDPGGYVDWLPDTDNTPPAAAILQPVNYSYRNSLAVLTGTAADNVLVTGVQAGIMRMADGYYWDGAVWVPTQTWLDASLSTTAWSYSNMPAWLNGASYSVFARAMDSSSNWSAVYSTSVFYYDVGLPVSGITAPSSSPVLTTFSGIAGTAWDNESFADRAEVRIRRISDGYYWHGSSAVWGAAEAWNLAAGSFTWTYNGLTEALLTNGNTYYALSRALDLANNVQTTEVGGSTFVYSGPFGDVNPPTVAILTPADLSNVTSLASIAGTAVDNVVVSSVALSILRSDTGLFWDGTQWSAGQAWLGAEVFPSSWTYANIPALVSGSSYTVAAIARDPVGNWSVIYATSVFAYYIPPAAPSLSASAAGVSSITWTWNDVLYETGYRVLSSSGGNMSGGLVQDAVAWMETGLEANTAYTRRVEAFNVSGSSASEFVTRYTLAAAPSSAAFSGASYSSVAFSWDGGINPGSTLYEYEISLSSAFSVSAASGTGTASSAWVTGLTPGAAYYGRVRAVNGDGVPTSYAYVSPVVLLEYYNPPPTVAILQPQNYSYRNSLTALTGTAADDVQVSSVAVGIMRLSDGYYWNGAAWAAPQSWLEASVSSPSWSFSATPAWVNGASYSVAARAMDNAGGVSVAYSTAVFYFDTGLPNSAVTVPASGAAIPSFSGLSGTAVDIESFTAQLWVGVKRTSDDRYWNGAISQWTVAQAWNLAAGSVTWSYDGLPEAQLTSGTTYFAVSRATDLAGNVQLSEALVSTFTFILPPPPELNALPFTGVAVSSLTVNWESTYSTGTVYYVRLATAPNAAQPVLGASTTAAGYTLTGLTPNTTYFGYVSTSSGFGYLLTDAQATLAMTPSGAAFIGIAYSSAGVMWSTGANPPHTYYLFQMSVSSSFETALPAVYQTHQDQLKVWQLGMTEGTTYYARLRAYNSGWIPTPYVYLGPVVTLVHVVPATGSVLGLLGTVLGSTSVYWTWEAGSVANADSYGVFSSSGALLESIAFSTAGASYVQAGLPANTPVSVKIAGCNSEGCGQLAQSATYYTFATAPGAPVIGARTDTVLGLTWPANGNPSGTGYQLWRGASADFSGAVIATSAAGSYTVSGLSPGTQYYFKVRAANGDGVFSDFSAVSSTATKPLLPAPPAAPSGSALGVSSITWSWATVSGAISYQVYPATAQAALLASPPAPAYIQEGLSPNTTYSIVASGVNSSGEGSVSPAAAAVATLAYPPSGAAVTAVYATSATLIWGLNGNPAGTTAKLQRVNTGTTFLTTGLTYTDAGLLGCTSYYFRVWNLNRAGIPTQYEEAGPGFTGNPIPLPPGNLSAHSLAGGRIALDWEPAPFEGITGYNLYYDAGDGSIDYAAPLASLSALQTSYTTGVLASSAAYKFGLRAAHRCGVEEQNTSVLAAAASIYSLTGVRASIKIPQTGKKVNGNSVTVMAELVTGAIAETKNVRLQYKPSSSAAWLNIPPKDPGQHPNPDPTSPYFIHWDVTGLAAGGYDLRAVATDLGNVSDPSPASVTITVDAAEADIVENVSGGKATKEQKVNNLVPNTLQAADPVSAQVTKLVIPAGALDASTATVAVTNNPAVVPPAPADAAATGIVTEVVLSNQSVLAGGQTAAVTLLFPDADNNGIVDGTTMLASQLEMYSAHSAAGPWERDLASVVDLAGKKVTGHTTHFSFFALFAPQAANINSARAYPLPWRPGSGGRFDSALGTDGITFDNLTDKTEIKIYTITGQLVRELKLTSLDLGVKVWDGKNSAGVKAASGVYLAHIKSGSSIKILKIAVER
ncbi:MAG: fibronectin type III domain-containing protein, partial [Elusimicrobia bacterium]|nr:fibronectin type III domain-containing protein [Elusimicrobiota bacterium]